LLTAQEWVSSRLGYRFNDAALLEAALTHRSAGPVNYERLEFLGDSVLNFVVAGLIFREFATAAEGELSRYRAALVSTQTLAGIAAELHLGDQLHLGSGELKTGGFRRESILADSLEALFGAVYLDGGVEAASRVIATLLRVRLAALPNADSLKDPKTRLQEVLQARGLPRPDYQLESSSGEPHDQWFVASCRVAALGLVEVGEGTSRRRAEQSAAQRVLGALIKSGEPADG
jgi:ribonuclease-3